MRVIRAADHRTMPWKNGGGSTTEIAVHPQGAGLGDFDWRVSMARVESDGPFSTFEGIDRTLSILGGEGIRLDVDGKSTELTQASAPFAFAGDAPASATLIGGPVSDLNVMTRRGVLSHRVWRLAWPVDVKPTATALVFCHQGTCAVSCGNGRSDLAAGDTAVIENEALRVAPATGSTCYLIEISPAG